MPRKKKLNRKRYREQKKIYHDLRLEEKIRAMRKARKLTQTEPLSLSEKALIQQVEAYRRADRFDVLELELINHERKAVGLAPFNRLPMDTQDECLAMDFECRRGRAPNRVGMK